MNTELVDVLKDNINVEENRIREDEIEINQLSYLQLRDLIWKIGRVVVELENQGIYIAAIVTGIANRNTAYLAIQHTQKKLQIVGYAKEGIFNQKTYEKAIEKLRRIVNEKESEIEK
jgi:hypothetical protein